MKKILCLIYFVSLPYFLINTLLAQSYQTVSKACGNCHKPVSQFASIGQKCPHCGVTWGRENTSVNSRTMIVDMPSNIITEDNHRSERTNSGIAKRVNPRSTSTTTLVKRSLEATNGLNGFILVCGLNSKSNSQSVYNIFGKPSTIKQSEGYEVWFYDIESFSVSGSDNDKKVMFWFDITTQVLSSYALIIDLFNSNSDQNRLRNQFSPFFKNDKKLDIVFSDKFSFQSKFGLPTETSIGDDTIFCSHVTDKVYISTQWSKANYRCEMFKVAFDKRMWPQ